MKKYQTLMVLVPILILGGCAGMGIDKETGCRNVSTTLKAKDAKGSGTTFIQVNPDTVKVAEGCKFTINNPGGEMVTVTSGSPWLSAGPTNADKIVIGPAAVKKTHKYKIEIPMGTLDPRAYVF